MVYEGREGSEERKTWNSSLYDSGGNVPGVGGSAGDSGMVDASEGNAGVRNTRQCDHYVYCSWSAGRILHGSAHGQT